MQKNTHCSINRNRFQLEIVGSLASTYKLRLHHFLGPLQGTAKTTSLLSARETLMCILHKVHNMTGTLSARETLMCILHKVHNMTGTLSARGTLMCILHKVHNMTGMLSAHEALMCIVHNKVHKLVGKKRCMVI